MHPYTTDCDKARFIHLALVVLSIGFAFSLKSLQALGILQVPWWIDTPSVLGFYGLFYKLFDKYLWRIPLLRKFGLLKIPNLNGAWKGYVTSSFDEHSTKHEATLEINQTWRKLGIQFKTGSSVSNSLSASILTEKLNEVVLSYEYLNEPRSNAKYTMHMHRGTAWLILKNDGKTLEGEYYTGRGRQTHGAVSFERKGVSNHDF